jgi:molecular chaperone DnaK (HSP70)
LTRNPEPKTLLKSNIFLTVIGIDLGREYARVGVLRNNTVELISDEQGRTAIPNYVAFTGHGHPLVGFEAEEQAFSNPKNTIYDFW